MGRQGIFIFIALIAIIAGLGMAVYGNSVKTNDSTASKSATPPIPPTANLLTVPDQKAGAVVTASEADLLQPGYVVIKDSRVSGKVLGVSLLLSASKNSLIFVNALTVKGQTYYAYLYGDNGDGKFGNGDQVLKDIYGSQIVVAFRAL
jgi:hypothetical protein